LSVHLPFSLSLGDASTTVTYTLSLHDALPIFQNERAGLGAGGGSRGVMVTPGTIGGNLEKRAGDFVKAKSAKAKAKPKPKEKGRSEEHRLNSSHVKISYAVFCLKKKKKKKKTT